MLCTVSTVKDSRVNVERFIERNLAAGADHMFVMLEQDDDGLADSLRAHPHVSPLLTDESYWHGARPIGLNRRQTVNADLVNTALSVFPSVEWLVHLDSDECLDIDRARLSEVPADARCFQLEPLEAVSREHCDGEVDRFKRRLERPDLALLTALGVIDSPANTSYFRGHVAGKAGGRPSLDLTFQVHHVRTRRDESVEAFRAEYLRLLHYESYSAEEFVRKWEALLSSGKAGLRESRSLLRSAVLAVQRNPNLGPDARGGYLRRLYKLHVEDQVDVLEELGFLVTPDPECHNHRPEGFSPEDGALIASLLTRLSLADKAGLQHGAPDAPAKLLEQVRRGLDRQDRALAERIDTCLDRGPRRGGPISLIRR